jgi:hypothetical protein
MVGDSLPLWLMEYEWHEDLSMRGQRDLTDSGWVVLDPRIAQLLKPLPGTPPLPQQPDADGYVAVVDDYGPPRMYVKALRPGTTTIRLRGVHGLRDAALESEVTPGVLERDVVVIRPPHRLEITPRPDTLRVGQYLPARVRVYDAMGEYTERVPVQLLCMGCAGIYPAGGLPSSSYYFGDQPTRLSSNEPGRMVIVARLEGVADTLSLVVVDSAAARK